MITNILNDTQKEIQAEQGKCLSNGGKFDTYPLKLIVSIYDNTWFEIDDVGQVDDLKDISLENRKQQLLDEFNPIVDEFALLTTRCRINYGNDNVDLEAVIGMVKQVKDLTISRINALADIDAALAFHINQDTVNYLKDKYKPFLF